jgi:serine/threonine protein kinase
LQVLVRDIPGLQHPELYHNNAIVLEYAAGGDMFSLVSQNRFLPENCCRYYFKQLLEGVQHIHSQVRLLVVLCGGAGG